MAETTPIKRTPRAERRAYWQGHVQRWRAGGQSKQAYCREHGLKPANLYRWCAKLGDGQRQGPRFIPVQLPRLAGNVRVYLCTEAVDMRKSFDGLSVLVMDVLEANPLSGALFAFCNRRGDKLKVLYYDGQGLCLWYKRLERGRFRMPTGEGDAVELSARELALLLDGLEVGLAAQMPRREVQAVA